MNDSDRSKEAKEIASFCLFSDKVRCGAWKLVIEKWFFGFWNVSRLMFSCRFYCSACVCDLNARARSEKKPKMQGSRGCKTPPLNPITAPHHRKPMVSLK